MTDASIIRAYAYATEDVEIATVELRHPLILSETGDAGVLRLASVFVPPDELEQEPWFEARLEADAPLDPGAVVRFIRAPIEVVRPERSQAPAGQVEFRFANVDAAIGAALIDISKSATPVAVTVRVFTMSSRLSGQPEVLSGFELTDPEVTPIHVVVRAQAPDVVNTAFHRQRYDRRFPLLGA